MRAHSMTPMPSSVTARSPHLAASRYGTTPGERLVRLADRLLNGADRPGADSARRGHLPTHDRPRLLQRALRRHHSGAHQRRIDLGPPYTAAGRSRPDHRGQDRPQAGVVVQIERLVDAEAARLGDTPGVGLGAAGLGRPRAECAAPPASGLKHTPLLRPLRSAGLRSAPLQLPAGTGSSGWSVRCARMLIIWATARICRPL